MAIRLKLKKDDLDQLTLRFAMTPITKPVFLNSVPKSGTHLLLNIVRTFVAPGQQYKVDAIQHATLGQHLRAFAQDDPLLSWGHLFFSDNAAVLLRDVNHIVLVRDPYDWVLARTRFFLSDQFQGNLNNIKGGAAGLEEVMNMMIFGVLHKAPTLSEIYNFNGVAWMGTAAHVLRYEDIIVNLKQIDTPAAETFFHDLVVNKVGVSVWPSDWRERIAMGSDRKNSATAREHLDHGMVVPDELPNTQKRLVDYHAPGLRRLLGYE
ncbi:MAG: hypothetical protein NW206_07450 [Hyphomonadaceae bacterium]|nr:hypothetical protein [Hyphomonadaceae bacterium]